MASFCLKQRQLMAAGTVAGQEGLDFAALGLGSGHDGLYSLTSHMQRTSLWKKALPSTTQPQEENPPGHSCVRSGPLSHAPACGTQGAERHGKCHPEGHNQRPDYEEP